MSPIDADALFDAMEEAEWYNNTDRDEVAERLIMDAQTVYQWIPCSERLPNKREVVLITNDKGNVRFGQFRGTQGKYWVWKGNTLETVLAWMPLPKPYKEGEE